MDASGRIGDRVMSRVLGWESGTRLRATGVGGVIVVRAASPGSFAVTAGGQLHLPAALRHWCCLGAGDRVLLAADPVDGLLVVHPPAVLDEVLAEIHAAVLGGDRRGERCREG
ncbi:AbrB/MazE/SpoVT family DNA-binding domain-containing protein [Micromonospora sp. NPDC000207]|uniref:AbrB/MazE/SpoVT family DNA-binding domain-containing protein n=1 Tax=Micromonospora sp. NPDC000207 TaxID=3154246 RepID=UPI003316D685